MSFCVALFVSFNPVLDKNKVPSAEGTSQEGRDFSTEIPKNNMVSLKRNENETHWTHGNIV